MRHMPTGAAALRLRVPQPKALAAWLLFVSLILAIANQARAQSALRPLDDAGAGTLMLKTETPGLYLPAPLLATDIDVTISGVIARTRVTQRFLNPADGYVEGIYVFPLSERAAVDTLRMQIGARFIEGKIKERREARALYEAAKSEGKKASLIEQERPNIFTNAVANIGPKETVVVQIEYQEALPLQDGVFSLRVPLVVAPRYTPAMPALLVSAAEKVGLPAADPVPDRARLEAPVLRPEQGKINPVTLTVHLNAGFPLGDITSTNHAIVLDRDGATAATVTLAEGMVPADQDFVLRYSAQPGAKPSTALLKETIDGTDYILALVVPPGGVAQKAPQPREVIFVIDNSGSMSGPSMREAKASLLYALDRLQPQDRFNVIRFDDTYDLLFAAAVDATANNVARAKAFVAGLDANGGTEMLPALDAALRDGTPDDTARLRQVLFLTDGAVGNEEALLAKIKTHLGRSRLFTVGIGSAPNGYFMTSAARLGRGTFTYIGRPEDVEERMAALIHKLEQPVMTDLTAHWPDGATVEALPHPLPDLYAGEPVLLTARLPHARGMLRLTGHFEGKMWATALDLGAAEAGRGLSKLWARSKIEALEEHRIAGGDPVPIEADILRVALDHHLVSRLTSLVAIDVTPARPADAPLGTAKLPLNLPAGWDFEKVFGEAVESRRADALPPEEAVRHLAVATRAASAVKPDGTALDLPQGATDARLLLLIGLVLTLIGAVLAGRRAKPGGVTR